MRLRWKRVLLKLSGEVLGGGGGPLDAGALSFYAQEIKRAKEAGAELAVVMGGGNVARGSALSQVPATAGHTIGMLATIINGVALREALHAQGLNCLLMSAIPLAGVAEPVDPWRAEEALAQGAVVLFAGGTGNPYVTTDTAAVIRSLSVGAQAVLKASKVSGIYDKDPLKEPGAVLIPRISHREYLGRGLLVMDPAAVAIAAANGLPILVFQIKDRGDLLAAMGGEHGSLVEGN